MDFINNFETITMAIMAAVIIGIAGIFKKAGLNPKFIPILNLVFGILGCIFLLDTELTLRVFNGIIVGLIASGLFSGAKNVKEGLEDNL